MGFLDKAKQMAEQAQAKLDDVQQQFNEGQAGGGGSAPGGPAVEYDKHGRPIPQAPPATATPPHGDPLPGDEAPEATRGPGGPVPDSGAPPAPAAPASPAPAAGAPPEGGP
jgi:hypothetical protein